MTSLLSRICTSIIITSSCLVYSMHHINNVLTLVYRATGSTRVFMNNSGIIRLPTDIYKQPKLSTGGLVGCIAYVVYVQDTHGTQYAGLTHYAARPLDRHIRELTDLTHRLHILNNQQYFQKASCIAIIPKRFQLTQDNIKTAEDAYYQQSAEELHSSAKKHIQAFTSTYTSAGYDAVCNAAVKSYNPTSIKVRLSNEKPSHVYISSSTMATQITL